MDLQPRITLLDGLKLIGIRLKMSFANNRTSELWQTFMPRRDEIKNPESSDLYSLQYYGTGFDFDPKSEFEKWALVPVLDFNVVPEGMEPYILEGGKYAVFQYQGAGGDPRIFRYIFTEWLPRSEFLLDNRPHFEVLGMAYKNDAPDSEEEIWIPIKT